VRHQGVNVAEDGLPSAGWTARSTPQEIPMRTMTCRQLGGPCDLTLSGNTADDVIKAQDRHLREAVRHGDAAHEPAHEEMKGRWRHPARSMGWYRRTKKAFAALPEA
jgi:predicted small metal-binding protein